MNRPERTSETSPFGEPFGLLNVHKPSGITSRDAVNRVQRFRRKLKVGHAGTLDPLASGVLVLCVGPATRLIEYVQRTKKCYRGTFLLGRTSPTEDVDGDVTELGNPPVPTPEEIAAAAGRRVGRIQQRPPAFSALKVDGRRAYDLARQGRDVELQPRAVQVYRIDVSAYNYPELTLEVECGTGTYVRSLGRDLAESLGTGAVMSALVRTAVGGFRLEEAVALAELTPETWMGHLLPPDRAVQGLPRVALSPEEVARIGSGQSIRREVPAGDAAELAAFDPSGRLVAILVPRGRGLLGPKRVFPITGG